MKRFLIAGMAGIMLSSSAMAGLISIRPILGYGLGTGKAEAGADQEWNEADSLIKDENMYYSAGGGIKAGLAADFTLLEGIAAGLEFGYSMGAENETNKEKWYSGTEWYTSSEKAKTSYIFVSPTVKISRTFLGITPFCAFGPTVAIGAKTIGKYEEESDSKYEGEMETTHNLAIGSFGILGIEYPIIANLSVFGQIRMDQLSLKASKGKVTKYTVDGEDQLADIPTRYKETEYKEDDSDDDWTKEDEPAIAHTFITPANSIGINLGVALNF